jgi:hypothetical protein
MARDSGRDVSTKGINMAMARAKREREAMLAEEWKLHDTPLTRRIRFGRDATAVAIMLLALIGCDRTPGERDCRLYSGGRIVVEERGDEITSRARWNGAPCVAIERNRDAVAIVCSKDVSGECE